MAWSTRLWLYHPLSEPLPVKFFPTIVPRGSVVCRRLALQCRELTCHKGARALAGIAQPLLRGHAVLVVAEDVLQRGRGFGAPRGDVSGDRFSILRVIQHDRRQDP